MKQVYACFCTDVIHDGHMNIINNALKHGELTVGLLTDRAMIRCDRFPTVSFEERRALFEKIPGVKNIVVQDDVLYNDVINTLRLDYVIHGDDWNVGPKRQSAKMFSRFCQATAANLLKFRIPSTTKSLASTVVNVKSSQWQNIAHRVSDAS